MKPAGHTRIYTTLTDTTATDITNALWDALPKARKGGFWYDPKAKKWKPKASAIERAALVARHFDEIDLRKAIENLAANEIEDRAFARTSRQIHRNFERTYRLTRRPVGHAFGGWTSFG
ncbi:hypothetical protein [Sphingopyxis sp. FD7]|uniref:hypothetical protein n=1 Tax=Sphingopyxis sp. FD7 TaxID=1914525 RepID=UPI000DC61BC5|nr:hypothetical protein [Sphingopyxis sp. FD7]BBB11915.1 hypothetical protein SPYCA_1173 [Sphingopyxis sp. FD7]